MLIQFLLSVSEVVDLAIGFAISVRFRVMFARISKGVR